MTEDKKENIATPYEYEKIRYNEISSDLNDDAGGDYM